MQGLPVSVEEYINGLIGAESPEEKISRIVEGFFSFFPFSRLSLFSYSPINFVGELIFSLHADGSTLNQDAIREDIRTIQPIYDAILDKKARYITVGENKSELPAKYVEKYKLSSVLVVPIKKGAMVIGCVLIDGYKGEGSVKETLVQLVENYFGKAFNKLSFINEEQVEHKLSKREIEVLEQLSIGWSTKEMASNMGISEFTARDYIASAMRKMNVRHRAQAIGEAIRSGLIS